MGSWAVQPDDIFSKYMILQAKPFIDRFGLGMARSHPYHLSDYYHNKTLVIFDYPPEKVKYATV
jgi:hypothetical protein